MTVSNNSSQYRDGRNGPPSATYGVGGFLWEIGKVFLLALIIITPIRMFLFQPFFVQGASMEPNFQDGEYLIINELGYKKTQLGKFLKVEPFKELERGDIVVFRYPKNPSQFFIKRVVGMPGEKVKIRDGRVEILNQEKPEGFFLDETSYLPEEIKTIGEVDILIKESEYFVLGDNRSHSFDSRSWGPIEKGDVIGKVLLRAWPFGRAQIF